jgi:hypothetical protein
MSQFFNLGKWIGKKSRKGGKAIDKVMPKPGLDLKKAYLQATQTKRNKAKITQSQMKVERDIEEGYKSVKKDD